MITVVQSQLTCFPLPIAHPLKVAFLVASPSLTLGRETIILKRLSTFLCQCLILLWWFLSQYVIQIFHLSGQEWAYKVAEQAQR